MYRFRKLSKHCSEKVFGIDPPPPLSKGQGEGGGSVWIFPGTHNATNSKREHNFFQQLQESRSQVNLSYLLGLSDQL